jgi:hypothetical protein
MRDALARYHGTRQTFYGVFIRFGRLDFPEGIVRWMLVEHVCDVQGRYLTDHCYVPLRPQDYVWTRLWKGCAISFEADTELYIKNVGRWGQLDYGLCHPSKVVNMQVRQA